MTKTSKESSTPDAQCSRRTTLASIALLPLVAQPGCGSDEQSGGTPPSESKEPTLEERYATSVKDFILAFNRHDLDAALAFFAESAVLTVNGSLVLRGHEAIRGFLIEYGASGEGALSGARIQNEGTYFTFDALFSFARLFFDARREISGFSATGLNLPIDVALLSKFGPDGHCTECDAVLNWGVFLPSPIS